jgi:hypothetical protein
VGSVCDSDTGACRDRCEGVTCENGAECFNGQCFDCFVLGCEDGEICVTNASGVGVCESDPCTGVTCDSGEFCRDGECAALTCEPACGAGEECVNGQCEIDRCATVDCNLAEICDPATGVCQRNACDFISCGQGQACNPSTGMCISDPCAATYCPEDFVCEVAFDGTSRCREVGGGEFVYAGGGGCTAVGSSGAPSGGTLALLGLMLLIAAGRRRPGRVATGRVGRTARRSRR